MKSVRIVLLLSVYCVAAASSVLHAQTRSGATRSVQAPVRPPPGSALERNTPAAQSNPYVQAAQPALDAARLSNEQLQASKRSADELVRRQAEQNQARKDAVNRSATASRQASENLVKTAGEMNSTGGRGDYFHPNPLSVLRVTEFSGASPAMPKAATEDPVLPKTESRIDEQWRPDETEDARQRAERRRADAEALEDFRLRERRLKDQAELDEFSQRTTDTVDGKAASASFAVRLVDVVEKGWDVGEAAVGVAKNETITKAESMRARYEDAFDTTVLMNNFWEAFGASVDSSMRADDAGTSAAGRKAEKGNEAYNGKARERVEEVVPTAKFVHATEELRESVDQLFSPSNVKRR